MVEDPADYIWSSYQINALGRKSELCTHVPLYLALWWDELQRQASYRKLFKCAVKEDLLNSIRRTIHSEMALGNDKLKITLY